MKYSIHIIVVVFISFFTTAQAQNTLTLEQAIGYTLENNLDIQMAKNDREIASQQNTIGNAGYLPTVAGNASANYGVNNSTIQFINTPEPTKIEGAENSGYGAGVTLNYKLFGGLGNFYTLKKLRLSDENASLQERAKIESSVLQAIQAYCNVLQAQNNLQQVQKSMEISRVRLEREKVKNEYQGTSSVTLLNAEVDYNTDSVSLINAQNTFEVEQYKLSQLMNKEEVGYSVADVQLLSTPIVLSDLEQEAMDNNASLLSTMYQSQISEKDAKLSKSSLMPSLDVETRYNFNHSENAASALSFSESSGFTGTLRLSIPIFDGRKKNIQYQNAQIRMKNAELSALNTEKQLKRDLKIAFNNYNRAKIIASFDSKNVQTAELNFSRTEELFNTGQLTGLEFREAQLNLLRTKITAKNNAINVKLAEVELMRLSGKLIE